MITRGIMIVAMLTAFFSAMDDSTEEGSGGMEREGGSGGTLMTRDFPSLPARPWSSVGDSGRGAYRERNPFRRTELSDEPIMGDYVALLCCPNVAPKKSFNLVGFAQAYTDWSRGLEEEKTDLSKSKLLVCHCKLGIARSYLDPCKEMLKCLLEIKQKNLPGFARFNHLIETIRRDLSQDDLLAFNVRLENCIRIPNRLDLTQLDILLPYFDNCRVSMHQLCLEILRTSTEADLL